MSHTEEHKWKEEIERRGSVEEKGGINRKVEEAE